MKAEKLISKSFEKLLERGKARGFITHEELKKSLGKRNSNPESFKILRTFQGFHHSWFPSYDLNVLTGDFHDGDFYDINEMGYQVTNSLFGKGVNYSNIVTDKNSLKGIREAASQPLYFFDNSLGNPKKRSMLWLNGDPNDPKWSPILRKFGVLVGIEIKKNKDTFIL